MHSPSSVCQKIWGMLAKLNLHLGGIPSASLLPIVKHELYIISNYIQINISNWLWGQDAPWLTQCCSVSSVLPLCPCSSWTGSRTGSNPSSFSVAECAKRNLSASLAQATWHHANYFSMDTMGYNQNWELHLFVQNIVQQFSKTAHLKASNILHSEEDCSWGVSFSNNADFQARPFTFSIIQQPFVAFVQSDAL